MHSIVICILERKKERKNRKMTTKPSKQRITLTCDYDVWLEAKNQNRCISKDFNDFYRSFLEQIQPDQSELANLLEEERTLIGKQEDVRNELARVRMLIQRIRSEMEEEYERDIEQKTQVVSAIKRAGLTGGVLR